MVKGGTRLRSSLAVLAVLTIGLLWHQQAHAQPRSSSNPPLVITSLYGPDVFQFYCASCHGRDARGRGPVAAALRSQPSDLATIARRNGGAFPKSRVEALLTNGVSGPEAHGTTEMPVWGPVFGGLDPSAARAKTRITNLVAYLESIQAK
jgi:mono/diheme cytochrome c family protein